MARDYRRDDSKRGRSTEGNTCPDCSNEVAVEAEQCPHCGYNFPVSIHGRSSERTTKPNSTSQRGNDGPSFKQILIPLIAESQEYAAIAKARAACKVWCKNNGALTRQLDLLCEASGKARLADSYGYPTIANSTMLSIGEGNKTETFQTILDIGESKGAFATSPAGRRRVLFIDENGERLTSRSEVTPYLSKEQAWCIPALIAG